MHLPATLHVDGSSFIAAGIPRGVALDRQDAPALAREVDALCSLLKRPLPAQIVFTAECAIRIHEQRLLLGLKRQRTLGIGWPMLFMLDADEIRGALALALCGDAPSLPPNGIGSEDSQIAVKIGTPLLARTLSRLYAAAELARADWFRELLGDARKSAEPMRNGLQCLRQAIETRGRGGWQAMLDCWLGTEAGASANARLHALGGSDVRGGSHRNVAQAWLWEGLIERLTTALEAEFAQLLAPIWQTEHQRWTEPRARARELESARRAGGLDASGQLELAGIVEHVFGARAAHALYRDVYARERRADAALGIARTLAVFDPQRARPLLEKLCVSAHPLSLQARELLIHLPIASALASRQTSATVPSI